jgi:hypothetical protein
MSGEKIPDSKKTGVLNEALDKLKNLGGRLSRAREVSEAVADAAIATAEAEETNTLPKPVRFTRVYFPLNALPANLLGTGGRLVDHGLTTGEQPSVSPAHTRYPPWPR